MLGIRDRKSRKLAGEALNLIVPKVRKRRLHTTSVTKRYMVVLLI